MWREMDGKAKRVFDDKAATDKARYDREVGTTVAHVFILNPFSTSAAIWRRKKTCSERIAPPYGVVRLGTSTFYTFPAVDQFIELNLYPVN